MTITLNGSPHDLPPGTTVAALVDALGLPHRGIALAVDREVVPRSRWNATVIPDAADVEVVTAVQGG